MNTTTYEVKFNNSIIVNKPSIISKSLGKLSKGTKIEVISTSGFWAYFKYNEKDAYILILSLQKVSLPPISTGSVTIKYLEDTTNTNISDPTVFDNLSLSSYTYSSKKINNYSLIGESTQSISLTSANPNQIIIFKYKKILGNIAIKFVDKLSQTEISDKIVLNNLELNTYTYSAKDIIGYSLLGDSSKTVTLTEDTPNIVITFEYSISSPPISTGSVTINYLEDISNTSISDPIVFDNLSLSSYTYSYKKINNYSLIGESTQSISLTSTNPNQIIIFKYKKILGNIAIKFVDKPSQTEISDKIVLNNLELNTYTYSYKDIVGYSLLGDSSKTVTLTEDNPNIVITFEYTVLPPILDESKQNEVPYISTYYIKPIVSTNEDVLLDFYITDFYHKEYINEDTSETFTVTININDLPSLTKTNMPAGDNSINLGKFNNLGEQKFSILCTDKHGRNSHELFNFFLVRNEVVIKEYIMTSQDLVNYNIDNSDNKTKVTTNRDGLQNLLDDKSNQGFNKLKLLPGIYRVDHLGTLYIPTNFTLDMNTATLKLNEFAGDKALMVELNNTFDSHVINGTIEGDYFNHDYTNSPNNSEWVNGISIGGESKYSSFENLVIKDITGYGASNGISNSRDGKLGYTYLSPKGIGNTFKLGNINRTTGDDVESSNRTTCDFRDISGYSDIGYLSVSRYLGYQGNPCGTWNLICHFYDVDKKYIISTDSYQYRRVAVPPTAKFVRVTILSLSYPTDLSIQLFRIPTHCTFKNLKLDNCRCVGMAQAAMKDMLVESCEFSKCGQSSAKCAYDAEDGWDMMQDITFKTLNFHDNPNNDFLTCAGHNFVVDGQVSGKIYIWERTRSLAVRNCKNTNISLQSGGISTIIKHGVYRVYNNEFTGGTVANNLSKNNKCSGSLGGIVSTSSLVGLVNNSIYTNCTIKINIDFLGYLSKISMINCDLIPESTFTSRYSLSFNGGHLNDNYFENCKFRGKSSLKNHNGFYSGKFIGCTFEDTTILPNVLANSDDIISFDNCNLGYSESNFIYYSPFAYSKGTFSNIQFNKCIIRNIDNNTKALIYAYAKPNGSCTFNNCIFTLPQNIIILDGYPSNIDYITDYSLRFINSPLTTNIQLISSAYKLNSNIKISTN